MIYFRARHYSPRLGRFIQTEPQLSRRAGAHFSYADNNPVCKSDPMGDIPQDPTRLMTGGPETIGEWERHQAWNRTLAEDYLKFLVWNYEFKRDYPNVYWAMDKSGRLLQVVGGGVETVAGGAMVLDPVPEPTHKIGGGILFLHGLDTSQAAWRSLIGDEEVQTYTSQGAAAGARAIGASENVAQWVGVGADLAPAIVFLRPGSAGGRLSSEGAVLSRELSGDLGRLGRPWVAVAPAEETIFVVRAGLAAPENLIEGTTTLAFPPYSGFSVQSAPGVGLKELIAAGKYANTKVSVTTLKRLRDLAQKTGEPIYVVFGTPGRGKFHATVRVPGDLPTDLAEELSGIFRRIYNPLRVKKPQ